MCIFLSVHVLIPSHPLSLLPPSLPVSGMGFGVIAGVVAFANTLKLSGGPAIVGVDDGGSQFFVLSSGEGGRGERCREVRYM